MRLVNSIGILLLLLYLTGISFQASAKKDKLQESQFTDLAGQYLEHYRYDSAALYYDSAASEADKAGDEIRTAYYLLKEGIALRRARLNDSSFKYLQRSNHLAVEMANDTIRALSDIELGWIYMSKGSLDSAKYHYRQALSIYKSLNDSLGIGQALLNLSVFYQTATDYETSLKYALESNWIFKKFNHKSCYARSLLNLGNIYDDIGDYDTAFACYDACYKLSSELNNLRLAGKAAFNKGYMYLRWKQYEEAEAAFVDAIDFCKKIKDYKDLSLLSRNLSIVQKKLGKWEEALENAGKSLDYARKVENKEYEFYALINLGVYYKDRGLYKLAESYYLKAAEMARKFGFISGERTIYRNLSNLYRETGNFESAYNYLIKYNRINDSIINQEKVDAREKYKAEYELLHYKDVARLKEMEKKKIRLERNLSYWIGASLIFLLIVFLFYFRMRARKNRIIAGQRIQKLEDEKKLMAAQSVMVGQEKERERIARELHDGIGVLLSTASIHFSSVESKTDKETAEMLKKANKLLREAHKEVRQISHNMMPGVLSKFGLREAIEDLFENVEEAGKTEVDLKLSCGEGRLPQNMEIMIYRVIQEMINNTLKHAKATRISFTVSRTEKEIRMEYGDNGTGFDEEKLPHGKNLGLSGIRSRVEYLGGTVELKSEKGKGTVYTIFIPLKNK